MDFMTSIIILTHNNLAYTKLCIKSIRKYTKIGTFELIIIDNASIDGTFEWLKQQNDIKYILNEKNNGFAGGCNQGIKMAVGTEILLLNNDTIVVPGWLENLRRALYSSPQVGAVGPVTNNATNLQSINVPYKNNEWKEIIDFGGEYNRINKNKGWQKKVRLIGFCMLIKMTAVKKVGLLDERFFPGNFEDDDYSLRLIQAGYDLLQCNDTFIHHFGGTSFKKYKQKYTDILSTNQRKFSAKWGIKSLYSSENFAEYQKLKIFPGVKILEIGCACGASLIELKAKFPACSIYGIDKAVTAATITNHYFPTIQGDIETMALPYKKAFFDYIILPDTLSCTINPLLVLKKIKPYLKENGSIILSCYNIMHYDIIKKLLAGTWSYTDNFSRDAFSFDQLRFFSFSTLQTLAKKADLQIKHYDAFAKPQTDTEENSNFINQLMETGFTPPSKEWELKTYRYIIYLQKKQLPAEKISLYQHSGKKDPKKICFITCVNNDVQYNICLDTIHNLNIPKGYSIETLAIKNAESMAQGYNLALKKTNAKYKIYLHQDVRIINKKIIFDILHLFRMDKSIGMVGTTGVYKIPINGRWWEAKTGVGLIIHNPDGGTLFEHRFEQKHLEKSYAEVNAVDGNLMVTQYDLPWREDLFKGWHFYDTSQCIEFMKKGYKVVVPSLIEPWNIHACGLTNLTNDHEIARKIFLQEYLPFLKQQTK
ncbi:glycosyltransferase [Pectinatus cerevisiiphilus]|uniref:GT2 family glycosyltransferase n=1 Tax=Pectinatus cerevisiiphilus TaxID=86956 RepID=A0A4R3K9C0_9FIRM|nr:glycosyltransferase [Pectinatus cerevisiiphilus]TCS79626.1 GT2 family glycosyltransferase [Pectinatus cerevisiiphilus]